MKDGAHTLQALIVDDEPPARHRLRKLLAPIVQQEKVRLIGEASDGIEALEKLKDQDVDLLFLDIQMPELNGFDILDRISTDRRPVVIFTTAYDSYALRAFEANAVDYLLKPISRERLAEAVDRAAKAARRPSDRRANDERLDLLLEWLHANEGKNPVEASGQRGQLRQISVPYRDRILLIPVDRVISAEINEGITRIFVLDEEDRGPKARIRQHVVSYTLDQLETVLPSERFMRVHRSAIVHLDHIQELVPWFSGRYKLMLAGGHEVIASRERSRILKDILMI